MRGVTKRKHRLKRIPRIFKDTDGIRYIIVKGKRIRLASDLTDKDLLLFVLKNVLTKRKRQARKLKLRDDTPIKHSDKLEAIGWSLPPENTSNTKYANTGDLKEANKTTADYKSEIRDLETKVKDLQIEELNRLALLAPPRNNMQLVPYNPPQKNPANVNIPLPQTPPKKPPDNPNIPSYMQQTQSSQQKTPDKPATPPIVDITQQVNQQAQDLQRARYAHFRSTIKEPTTDTLSTIFRLNRRKIDPKSKKSVNKSSTDVINEILASPGASTLRNYIENDMSVIATDTQILQDVGKLKLGGTTKKTLSTADALNDHQIDELMAPYRKRGYIGTFTDNELHKVAQSAKPRKPLSFIMLEDSYKPIGHWVAVYIDPEDDLSLEYYNPVGNEPTERFQHEIKQVIQKLAPEVYLRFKVNRIQDQGKSSNCGYFSVKFLMDRYSGKPFRECSLFDDHVKGEAQIERFKKSKYPKFTDI
jgi:hypothetical protein